MALNRAGSQALGLLQAWPAGGSSGRISAVTQSPHPATTPTHISHTQHMQTQPTHPHPLGLSQSHLPTQAWTSRTVSRSLTSTPHKNSCVCVCVCVICPVGAPLIPFRSQPGQRVAVETCPHSSPEGRGKGPLPGLVHGSHVTIQPSRPFPG